MTEDEPQGGDELVMTASEVADLLRLSRNGFLRGRRRMQRGGFPPPLIGVGKSLRWSRFSVEHWIKTATTRPDMLTQPALAQAGLRDWEPEIARRIAASPTSRTKSHGAAGGA